MINTVTFSDKNGFLMQLVIYCGTTNNDIIMSSSNERDKSDDSEKDYLHSIS